jgi:hypothetical protein
MERLLKIRRPRAQSCRKLGPTILLQVRQHKIVASLLLRGFDDGCSPSLRTIDNPIVEVVGNLGEGPTHYSFPIPIGIAEPQYSLRLLEGLKQPVQQDPIETSIYELDANSCGARRKRSWRSPV